MPTYSISGNCNVPAGVVIYAGALQGSVTADASGNYTISNLVNGSYTIAVQNKGYKYTPTVQNVVVNSANVTGVNFTATVVAFSSSARSRAMIAAVLAPHRGAAK